MAGRNNARTKRKPYKKRTNTSAAVKKKNQKLSSELKGIILIALGAFLALSLLTDMAGVFGKTIKNIFMGFFGSAAKIFFLYIIWMGVDTFLERKRGEKGLKPYVLLFLVLFSSVFVSLCMGDTAWFEHSFFDQIRNLYAFGTSGFGGGIIGSGLAKILYRLLGWGTWILTIAVLIIMLVVLTETSLEKVIKNISCWIKKRFDKAKEKLDKEIDVPLKEKDDEKPKAEDKVNNKNNEYFNIYFESEDEKKNEDFGENKADKKFSFSDEDLKKMGLYTSDITLEEKDSVPEFLKENDEVIDLSSGIQTTLPDEDGKYHQKGAEEDFEPPSEVKIKDQVDIRTKAALDSGAKLDEAVLQGQQMTKEEAEAAKKMVENAVKENIEQTKLLNYKLPPLSLLADVKQKGKLSKEDVKNELEEKANKLLETLLSFKVEAKILNITKGPSVTRFELQPGFGVKVSKITHLADDIALSLAAPGVRIEAPIPGKSAIGIEIPNETASPVPIREVIGTDKFSEFKSKTAFALGKDISGNCVIADISDFPHVLIAGATGSGKSVCINSLIASILYKAKPNEVKMIMIDPKMVELGVYNGIPHLLIPVVTDPKHAAGALNWAVTEMKNRYKLLKDNKVKNIEGFNNLMEDAGTPELKMPEIVIIIDELADLMLAAKNDVEDAINSLAALARAAGMYLVIATQRPSVDVITGVIKANVPSRISFAVSSQIDSRTILDAQGAEKLLGKGDMLYAPRGAGKPIRIQGNFLSDVEIEKIINFIKNQYKAEYDESIIEQIEKEQEQRQNDQDDDSRRTDQNHDELFYKAAEMFVDAGQGSVAMLQRRFKIGYQRAARLIDQLEEARILGEFEGSKPRRVLITRQELNEMLYNNPE